jgi:hypothetical protein
MMLQRIRHKWIAGVLEPSLANAARLALGLQPRPDVLTLGRQAYRQLGRPLQPIPGGTPISEVFDKVGGGLLILGEPGAGKTTLLLQLARELLDRAEHDPSQPIPVVVNLSSWARQRKPLAEWLADELVVGYTVPRRQANAWLAQESLTLLLDGLDEVADPHRAGCAAALNTWREEHGLVPLAVCSRTAEFQALATELRVEEAVELQPPTPAEVEDYLGYLEATGTPLGDVRAALESDQELQKLLRSPLMLHVVALAYHGRPALALEAPGSVPAREARLWEAYVARMFEQHPLDPDIGYTTEQAHGWLVWLARMLRDQNQTEFHLDRLTSQWLASPAQQRAVRWVPALISGLTIGLAFGLGFGLGFESVVVGLAFELAVGLAAGLAIGLAGDIEPTEQLSWSWREFRRRWASVLALVPVSGVVCGVVFGVVFGRGFALVGVVGGVLAVVLGFGLTAGLTEGLRDERATPNEGIRLSAKNGLVAGLAFGLAIGLAIGLAVGLAVGLAFGLAVGLAVGLGSGGAACLQHYAIRTALAYARVAPWRYGQYLEAMAQRLLLARGGSAYLFSHRLLRDQLAAANSDVTLAARNIHGDS